MVNWLQSNGLAARRESKKLLAKVVRFGADRLGNPESAVNLII